MSDQSSEGFMLLLTDCQKRLYGYVYAMLGDREQTRDVVQNISLVLWRRSNEYIPGTNFTAWAYSIAYYEVLAHRKKQSRDKLVFTDEFLLELHESLVREDEDDGLREKALVYCLEKLPARNREMLKRRYAEGHSQKAIAEQFQISVPALAMTLHRSRLALLKCIQRSLAQWRTA